MKKLSVLFVLISGTCWAGMTVFVRMLKELGLGTLDVVLVRKMNKLRMLCALSGLMKGKILTFKETSSLRVKKLSVAGQGLRINIDGEIITADRADIEVLPGSLLVRRPAVLPEAPNI